MLSPSNEDRICAMFDSFCKTVSRNFVRNLDRAEGNRDKHFSDEPVDYLLETLGRRDEYPSESFVLYVGGSSCAVESETLYKALWTIFCQSTRRSRKNLKNSFPHCRNSRQSMTAQSRMRKSG